MQPVVSIRRPTDNDADRFLDAVRRSETLHAEHVSPPNTSERFHAYTTSLAASNREGFIIEQTESHQLIGVINVSEIVRGCFQSAYLGYYAFAPHAGRGWMRQGLRQVIQYCFSELNLHRLEANIQPDNHRSISLVKGLGFQLEGFSPQYLMICGQWRDHERWALLRDRWEPDGDTR